MRLLMREIEVWNSFSYRLEPEKHGDGLLKPQGVLDKSCPNAIRPARTMDRCMKENLTK